MITRYLPIRLINKLSKVNLNKYSDLPCFDNQIISSKDIAMPEKKTSSMLIRDIPMDVWERIDKLCRHRNMKRRDFVEQALRFFEGEEPPDYVRGLSKTSIRIKTRSKWYLKTPLN